MKDLLPGFIVRTLEDVSCQTSTESWLTLYWDKETYFVWEVYISSNHRFNYSGMEFSTEVHTKSGTDEKWIKTALSLPSTWLALRLHLGTQLAC